MSVPYLEVRDPAAFPGGRASGLGPWIDTYPTADDDPADDGPPIEHTTPSERYL